RPAVAHLRGDGLLAVQVAEGDVAEAREQLGGHLAHPADADVALGFAGRSPADPAVRHDHTALYPAGLGVGPGAAHRGPRPAPGTAPRTRPAARGRPRGRPSWPVRRAGCARARPPSPAD